MIATQVIQQTLAEYGACINQGERIAVPTQLLYPSNGIVFVYVSGGPIMGYLVTDAGGAVTEISRHGLSIAGDVDRFLHSACRARGLKAMTGAILSPRLPIEGVAAGVVMVAASSVEAAAHGIERFQPPKHRILSDEIWNALAARFAETRLSRELAIRGASNRQYHFDFGPGICPPYRR